MVNFVAASKDKIEGNNDPSVGVSYGHWGGWHGDGWGVGIGNGGSNVRSVREGTVTVDLVDKTRNELIWSGSAAFHPSRKDDSKKRIDDGVARIFGKFPTVAMRTSR